jgi:AcrR family transcriptional regulator
MGKTENTKLLLMRTAERLFLERGFELVSLREIAAAAGQGNPAVVAYHFGDLRGLVNAILARHSEPIQAGWLATLAHADATGVPMELQELSGLLVRPIVDKLDDQDGGLAYLDLCATLVTSKSIPLLSTSVASTPGASEISRRIMLLARPRDPSLLVLSMVQVASVIYLSISSYVQLRAQGMDIDREAFVINLIGTTCAQFA